MREKRSYILKSLVQLVRGNYYFNKIMLIKNPYTNKTKESYETKNRVFKRAGLDFTPPLF